MGYYILTYLCLAVFITAVGRLMYRHLTIPVHLRWEIYPVQGEPADKVSYGGSYMEEMNWWEKKRKSSRVNEIFYMAPEILLMRGLWKENKRLWQMSFPLHLGLYLMLATFLLLSISSVSTLCGFAEDGGIMIVNGLSVATGWIGLIAGVIGSTGMLYKRLADRELRDYSTFADYFNIVFILIFFLCAFVAASTVDPLFNASRDYVLGLFSAGRAVPAYVPGRSLPGALTIILASLLTAYIPLTHLSHMFMKFFLYHRVKWDDTPNRPGSPIETAVKKNLEYRPTWKARHVDTDGKLSWREIASSAPKEMK